MQKLRANGKAEAWKQNSRSGHNIVWHTLSHSTWSHHISQTKNSKLENYISKSPGKSQEHAYKISHILDKASLFHEGNGKTYTWSIHDQRH